MHIHTNNIRTWVDRAGSGPAVVFIHGLTQDHTLFSGQREAFAKAGKTRQDRRDAGHATARGADGRALVHAGVPGGEPRAHGRLSQADPRERSEGRSQQPVASPTRSTCAAPVEKPELFSRIVLDFLDRARRPLSSQRKPKALSDMKSAVIPQVRVEPELRAELEAVLHRGETLSGFIEASLRSAVEFRRAQQRFHERGQAAWEHYERTRRSVPADKILAKLEAKLNARRKQLRK